MSIFKSVKNRRPQTSQFDLSHERKFSMNMGELIPILCEPVVPGDTFKMNTETMMRLAPMVSPVMHRVNVYCHFFFVPNRIIWDNFKDFITGGESGTESPVAPYFNFTGGSIVNGSLHDYLGIATGTVSNSQRVSALPFRAYSEIYNEYYRDQNLQAKVGISKADGYDTTTNSSILKRCWEKDYFTSALPWTQRGGDVNIPLGDTAPIIKNPNNLYNPVLRDGSGDPYQGNVSTNAAGNLGDGSGSMYFDPNHSLTTDLSDATSASITDLRRATKLQEWLEIMARSGSRYVEQIRAIFGVISSDARLQRPEFLGGGKQPVTISEVLQTSESNTTPQGGMAGHGISVGNTMSFKKFFEEHGFVIGIMSVLPRTSYQQGTRRYYRHFDKFDYPWPQFARIGEQPVYGFELYNDYSVPNGELEDDVFGYQSRYSDFKYIPSSVHGEFKDDLDFWHMGREFGSKPNLNAAFVQSDPTHRIFAVSDPSEAKLYVQIYNNLKAIRPLPYYGTPQF